jgi:filamentous hemagglutinin family protein
LTGPNYAIPHDLGQTRGANLFHSFEQFNVLTGESATFTGPNTIQRVISRVTGGVQSFIDGLLGTDFAGAKPELYLVNPSGILFGPNASLNVSGSAHFSTADYLRFADQTGQTGLFATLSETSTFSVEPVAAFGFLTDTPAPITLQRSVNGIQGGATLRVPAGNTFSLIGGDITMTADPALAQSFIPTVAARSGLMQLASSRSIGEIPANVADLLADGNTSLGEINLLQGAVMDVGGNGGGTAVIRAGRLTLDGSLILGDSRGNVAGKPMAIDAQLNGEAVIRNGSAVLADTFAGGQTGALLLKAGQIEVNRGIVGSRAFGGSTADTGTVTVLADTLALTNASVIETRTMSGSSGRAGPVTVQADNLILSFQSQVRSQTSGSGNAGDVMMQTNTLTVDNNSQLSAITFGRGAGGRLLITGNEWVSINSGGSLFAFARGTAPDAGPAGGIDIMTKTLTVTGTNTQVAASTFGPGAGGTIHISADMISLSDSANIFSNARGTTATAGNAGAIAVEAQNVMITGGAFISSNTFGRGNGGTIRVTARDTVSMSGVSAVDGLPSGMASDSSSSASGAGNAGTIIVEAKYVTIAEGAAITSISNGPGTGGTIQVTASETVTVTGSSANGESLSALSTDASGTLLGAGSAGGIMVHGRNVAITNGGLIQSATIGPGTGGTIRVTADETVTMTGLTADGQSSSRLTASSGGTMPGAGPAGSVVVNASDLTLTRGAQISSNTDGPGNGGIVAATATNGLTLSDPGTAISTASRGAGVGGTIRLSAARMDLSDHVTIVASSTGAGNAGDISLIASDRIRLVDSSVKSEAAMASGGNVKFTAPDLIQLINGEIVTSVMGGAQTRGGDISIDPQSVVFQNSRILATATQGNGGNITIIGNVVLVDPGSFIDASSSQGVSGQVAIQAPVNNVAGALSRLSQTPLNAAELLTARCAARLREGRTSSLTLAGRDGVPAEPGSWRPTAFLVAGLRPTTTPTIATRPASPGLAPITLRPSGPEFPILSAALPLPSGCGS